MHALANDAATPYSGAKAFCTQLFDMLNWDESLPSG